jgi:hypothetical protein
LPVELPPAPELVPPWFPEAPVFWLPPLPVLPVVFGTELPTPVLLFRVSILLFGWVPDRVSG